MSTTPIWDSVVRDLGYDPLAYARLLRFPPPRKPRQARKDGGGSDG